MTEQGATTLRAAEFVLGVLSPEDRLAFSSLMIRDPAVRAEATFWSEHFAQIGAQAAPVTPPASAFVAVKAELFGAEAAAASKVQWARRAAGAFLIIACSWTLVAPYLGRENPRSNDLLATLQTDDERIVANATFDPDTTRIYVQRVLGAVVQDRNLQVWFIVDGGAPVSLGVLPQAEQMVFRIARRHRDLMARAVIAISDEAEGSSARIAPKGPIVAIAPLVLR